jgi:hypothetical protein
VSCVMTYHVDGDVVVVGRRLVGIALFHGRYNLKAGNEDDNWNSVCHDFASCFVRRMTSLYACGWPPIL